MAETPQKHVFFAGSSASVRETLNDTLASRGILMRAFRSVDDCRESLGEDNCHLLVVELDGDAAAGLQLLAQLKHEHPQTLVLALVDHGNIPLAVKAIQAGAADCLQKPVETEPLIAAVDELLEQADPQASVSPTVLTSMEMTVLRYIAQGKTSRQIADTLYRSRRTIEVHRSHIMRKLGVSSMVDLVRAASAMGLLEASGRPSSGPARASHDRAVRR